MRVRGGVLSRLRRDQHGAVIMIVAVSLVVLFAIMVLAVDLGRVVASRRDYVRASDSAVLAAAQQCAKGNGAGAALSAADATAVANEAAAAQAAWSPEWGNGGADAALCAKDVFGPGELTQLPSVRVGYEREIEFFFAPVFGFDTGTVREEATAVWGPVVNPLIAPISVDYATLLGCGIPQTTFTPISCQLDYFKDTLKNPRWGELVLERWGEEFAADVGGSYCSVSASDLRDQIINGIEVPLEPKPPTWDCLDNGLSFSVWSAMKGKTLTFPVIDINRSTGKTKPGDQDCNGTNPNCQIDTAYVLSFVCLNVVDVQKKGPDITLQTVWSDGCSSGGIPDPTMLDLGVHGFRLVG